MGEAVSITGIGIVCAIGNDAASVLKSLREGRSGIGRATHLDSIHSDLPVGEVSLSCNEMKRMLGADAASDISRTSLMGALAVREALEQAGIGSPDGRRVALVSGTTVGVMDLTERNYERMRKNPSQCSLPLCNECGRSTLEIAALAKLEGAECCTISTACSSALNAIIIGAEMLRNGEADIVIAGGSEALSKFHLNGFNSLMILDREICRPFDGMRAGLNLGEGAAYVVLQKDAPRTLAYVSGYANRCDAFHQTASSENGEGAYLAMTGALEMAGLKPEQIQYVNAHGTGTQNNDQSESRAIRRVFGESLPEVSSTKSYTGHTTSASGSIETVISILAMLNGFTPSSPGWKNPMADGIVPTRGNACIHLENVMCNSFGFGGNDSSLILSLNRPDCLAARVSAHLPVEVCAHVEVSADDDLSALREFVPPMESRRMCRLMKVSHLSAFRAMRAAGVECPDAIISATSRGMLETSVQFLEDIIVNGETLLKPTLFMQSTHNTVASSLAVRTGCHGYNITYSQGDDSLEWAMRDARRLIAAGNAGCVLVTAFDETVSGTTADSCRAESFILKAKSDE